MNPGYDTEGWEAPYRYSDMNQAVSPGNLHKIISKEEWQKFLNGEQSILIPPNAKVSVEISAGVERTAYLHLALDRVQRRRFLFFSQKDMYLEENEVI